MTTTKKRWVVSAVECGGRRRYRECGVLADTEGDARSRAVTKWFGANAYWAADSGLGPIYGQVVGKGGHCLTDRIRIDAEPASAKVRHVQDGDDWQTL